ncbi:unnamed protein product [Diamesa serratosioi]
MDNSIYSTKFNKIECSISENKTCIDPFCYISTDNQSITYMNFGCTLTRAIDDFQVSLIMYKKSGNGYRRLLKTPLLDFCDIIKNNKVNPIVKQALNVLRDSYPNLLKKCPWTGSIEIYNLTSQAQQHFPIFPFGTFKVVWWLADSNDNMIIKANLYFTAQAKP